MINREDPEGQPETPEQREDGILPFPKSHGFALRMFGELITARAHLAAPSLVPKDCGEASDN